MISNQVRNKYKKHSMKDILECLGKNKIDTEITKSIIEDIENTLEKGLNERKCVSIPYIGRIRRSEYKEMIAASREELREVKNKVSLEEYKQYRRDLYKSFKEKCRDRDRTRTIIDKVLRLNKKKYNLLYSNCGKAYADMWIKKIGFLQIVEHDINDPNEI